MRYDPERLADSVDELSQRVERALTQWDVDQERIVRHAIAKIGPFDFEIVMLWGSSTSFSVGTSGEHPRQYEEQVAIVHGNDESTVVQNKVLRWVG